MAIILIAQLPLSLLLVAGNATGATTLTENSKNISQSGIPAPVARKPETKAAAITTGIGQECSITIVSYNVGGRGHVVSSDVCTVSVQTDGTAAKQK